MQLLVLPPLADVNIKCVQVHRGTLKTMSENARNNATTTGDKNGNKTNAIIEAEPFVPIRGRIRQMEDEGNKLDALKQSKNEDNHFKRLSQNLNGNGKTDTDDNATTADCDVDSNKVPVAVPTPLPRTSRTNSMTDPSSSEESSSAAGSPRPSPMPRVTIGSGYKVPGVEKDCALNVVVVVLCCFSLIGCYDSLFSLLGFDNTDDDCAFFVGPFLTVVVVL